MNHIYPLEVAASGQTGSLTDYPVEADYADVPVSNADVIDVNHEESDNAAEENEPSSGTIPVVEMNEVSAEEEEPEEEYQVTALGRPTRRAARQQRLRMRQRIAAGLL